jgi:hypothetical protein
MLKFSDDTQIRVTGLVEILADLYAEGRPENEATAEEIINRLEAKKNYIPSSDRSRREYAHILLKEYRKYISSRADNNRQQDTL